mgnify:CR=1 FL=1
MTEKLLMKSITNCEECPYYETTEHEDYGKYYTNCTLFDVEIVSKEGYQPQGLFSMCELPTHEKSILKLSGEISSDLVELIHKYAKERSELSIKQFFLWLKLYIDTQMIYKLSEDEVVKEYNKWAKF